MDWIGDEGTLGCGSERLKVICSRKDGRESRVTISRSYRDKRDEEIKNNK